MAKTKNRKRADALVDRDGDLCWLCGQKVDFEAVANTETAWSVEHLVALRHNGPDNLENLALCHPPCNQKLRDLSLSEKIALRDEVRRKQWIEALVARAMQTLAA